MRVTKKMMSIYLNIHQTNVKRHYQAYLDALQLSRSYLTVFDVAKYDNITPHLAAKLMNVTDKQLLKRLIN